MGAPGGTKAPDTDGWDTLVVGAGSAGCVLAARLSENPSRRVLLLEAGPDYPDPDLLPPEIRSSHRPAFTHDWGYRSEPGSLGRSVDLNRGKLVGGCSATNATFALRGNPAGYDGWAAAGNPGWSYAETLPYFRRIETDLDFDDEWHGHDGPVRVRRFTAPERSVLAGAFLAACADLGLPAVADHNRPGAIGAGPTPVNAVGGVRQSCALSYLAPARWRPNLTIRADVLVDSVTVTGTRATGVRLAGGELIAAEEIVVSAGAYGSPALLWRSGIGPVTDLARLGIRCRVDLPGVGAGLTDHPLTEVVFGAPCPPPDGVPGFQAMLTAASSAAGPGIHDLQVFPWTGFVDRERGPVFILFASVMLPASRGSVRLRSADPAAAPVIDPRFLQEASDRSRLTEAVELARSVAAEVPLKGLATGELHPGTAPLSEAIRAGTSSYHHPVGTCRMGPAADPLAVVDGEGRVHGAGGLRVVDASIMPSIPAANTNLPTIMVAECIAEAMAAE